MDLQANILNQYQYPDKDHQNLTTIIALPGAALVALVDGLALTKDLESSVNDPNKKQETFYQVFYCYQPNIDDKTYTHLLLGTNYYLTTQS